MNKIIKLLWLISSVTLLFLLDGCLVSGNDNCLREESLQQFEFFLMNDGNRYYISQTVEPGFDNFNFCEEILPEDSVGIANIYAINGKLVDNCDEGICIRVYEYVLPYCEATYSNNGGTFGIIGSWQLAHLYDQDLRLHPSCNFADINWTFEYIEESTGDMIGKASFGSDSLSIVLSIVNDSLLTVSQLSRGTKAAVPYVAYFEQEVADFLEAQDTILYQINGSEMTFSSVDVDFGLRFFKP